MQVSGNSGSGGALSLPLQVAVFYPSLLFNGFGACTTRVLLVGLGAVCLPLLRTQSGCLRIGFCLCQDFLGSGFWFCSAFSGWFCRFFLWFLLLLCFQEAWTYGALFQRLVLPQSISSRLRWLPTTIHLGGGWTLGSSVQLLLGGSSGSGSLTGVLRRCSPPGVSGQSFISRGCLASPPSRFFTSEVFLPAVGLMAGYTSNFLSFFSLMLAPGSPFI